MKVHPDGTITGTPAECAEYLRLKGERVTPPAVTTFTTDASRPWQPRSWPYAPLGSGGVTFPNDAYIIWNW
jgi:hypothetical protein